MKLPGGILVEGKLRREFTFKPITGELQKSILESPASTITLPEQITTILANTLDTVANQQINSRLVRSLNCGDRQFLMIRLEALLNPSPQWHSLQCSECKEKIQFQFTPGTLPVKPAGVNFPETSISLSFGECMLRTPTGADEEAIAAMDCNEKDAVNFLINRLLSKSGISGRPVEVALFTEDDYLMIDNMLDQMSPQSGDTVSIECPYCSVNQHAKVNTYAWLDWGSNRLEQEIHTLALNYHWSERDILSLPRTRRERYLQLIEGCAAKYQAQNIDFESGTKIQ